MMKIMLVVDDFSELTFLETCLKKLGFDVLGLSKDIGVAERLLGFPAELMLVSARGKMIDGIQIMKKVKKSNPGIKVVLLHPVQSPPQMSEGDRFRIDGQLETPTDPTKLIHLLARIGRLDANTLLEKYAKFSQSIKRKELDLRLQTKDSGTPANATQVVPGERDEAAVMTQVKPGVRTARYDAYLADNEEPVGQVLAHERMEKARQELRADALKEDPHAEDQLLQKQAFVKAMFTKK